MRREGESFSLYSTITNNMCTIQKKGYLFIANGSKPKRKLSEPTIVDINNFSHSSIDAANRLGYKLYLGTNVDHPELMSCRQYDLTYYDQHVYRNIFAFQDNYNAYKKCCRLLDEHPDIKVIHCNTPIGGIIGRICGHKFNKKVIYTAHGFHFYKGAPLKNWLFFYPIERMLAHWTDVLITINKEDFQRAHKFKLHNHGKIYYVPGVGVDTKIYSNLEGSKNNIREDLKLGDNAVIVVAVGRLDKNKNFETVIKAIAETQHKNIHFIVCGDGDERLNLVKLINDLHLSDRVHLLGRCSDMPSIYKTSDIFVLSSFREGLFRSIMEAMASELPCVVSNIRGNVDLIDSGKGGYLVSVANPQDYAQAFDDLAESKEKRIKFGKYNKNKVQGFSLEVSKEVLYQIFKSEL